MSAPALTQAQLKTLLSYDPETGEFTWLRRSPGTKGWNGRFAGKRAGYDWTIGSVTYRCIRVLDWPFLGHRLAWLYMTGEWPALIDHRDGNGLNNRWSNLRLATRAQNAHNAATPRTNTSGFKGVSFHRGTGRYRAYLKERDRQIWLGYHDTAEAAHAAVVAATAERRGEFGRVA